MDAAARQAALLQAVDDLAAGSFDVVVDRCAQVLLHEPRSRAGRVLVRAVGEGVARPPTVRRAAEVLQTCGDQVGAAKVWAALVRRDPRDPVGWRALAALHVHVHDHARARQTLEQALQCLPDHPGVLADLGLLLARTGDAEAAAEYTARAVALAPDDLRVAWADLRVMPVVHTDVASMERWRSRYAARLRSLVAAAAQAPDARARLGLGAMQDAFFAHYACRTDDIELQRIYGGLVSRLVARVHPALVAPLPPRPVSGRRRVAFVSSTWRKHTIGRLFGGWVDQLDRERFHVELWQLGVEDGFTRAWAARCDHYAHHPASAAAELGRGLRARGLDAVVFPEVGMDRRVIQLAAMRLAPRQAVSWGHPVTTGLPTLDTFLSSAAMEPPGADEAYTEALHLLPGLGICLRQPPPAPGGRDRASFGLDPDDVVLLCTQSIFKLLPQRDRLFADIVRRVPRARLVLLAGPGIPGGARMAARLDAAGIPAARRVLLPGLSHDDFLDLNTHADVWLDGPDWSGGMTTIEALACGAVPVTLDGALMRTRHTAAILRELGVTDTIAATPEAWVDLAVALGQDPERRAGLRARLAERLPSLWGDTRGVRALEAWIEGPPAATA